MSHETHHQADNSPKTSSTSAFWFVIILVGLFIAAVNFVNVMGNDEGHGDSGHGATEAHETTKEATASQTLEGETGTGRTVADTARQQSGHTAADTTHAQVH